MERIKKFILVGSPISLARCRFSGNGHQAPHVFDTQKEIKLLSGLHLRKQMDEEKFAEGIPLEVNCVFYFDIPKSRQNCKNKKMLLIENDLQFGKPDVDNLIKFILDISNRIIYKDDAQVQKVVAEKRYSKYPRTEFIVKTLK